MGLCIYYSGRIKDAESLPKIIELVKEVAEVHNWKYYIDEPVFPNNKLDDYEDLDNIYGISFVPPESESICINFLSNGVMVCPSRVKIFGNSKNPIERNWIYQSTTKTQYAGMAVHAIVINLFRHLNENYLSDFNMIDEGGYWDTADDTVLREKFRAYDRLLDNFCLSMETFPAKEGENMMSYFDRLLGHINKLQEKQY